MDSDDEMVRSVTEGAFLRCLGPREIHDSRILRLTPNGDMLEVKLQAYEGGTSTVHFLGVTEITSREPVGMTVYSLSEVKLQPPSRYCVFSNWDDEDTASLEVIATDVRFPVGNQRGA